jgi:hypothetical protein
MTMRGRLPVMLFLLGSVAACGVLDKLKGAKDAGEPEAAVADTASAPSASASVAAADPTPSASAANEPFSPPGSCVDPVKDAKKRQAGMGEPTVEDIADLDGDGKKDKSVGFIGMGMNWPFEIYVMRGTCGHYVGEINGKGVAVTGLKSHGLKSLSTTVGNPCTEPCGCMNQELPFYYSGKQYTAGKAKDVLVGDPCDAGAKTATADAGAKDAGAAAAGGPYKVGDKVLVSWKGQNWPAAVIAVPSKDHYKIHYDNYASSWDEVVGPDRIKGRR